MNGTARWKTITGAAAATIAVLATTGAVALWALDSRYTPRAVHEADIAELAPHVRYVSCVVRTEQRGQDPAGCETHLPPEHRR